VLIGCSIAATVYDKSHDIIDNYQLTANTLETLSFILALFLHLLERRKSYNSSNILLLYWSIVVFPSAIKFRTIAFGCVEYEDIATLLYGSKLLASVLILCMECFHEAGIRLDDSNYVSYFFILKPIF
jgi:hypothetical protein